MDFNKDKLDLFWWFVNERQSIWNKRYVQKLPQPWTTDIILRKERFTNVYRELDPGTQYAISILETKNPKPDKIFNIMLYRLIGKADTHKIIGFQKLSNFNSKVLERKLKEVKIPFTGAYMVSPYNSMGSKDKIVNVSRLFGKIHKDFDSIYEGIDNSSSSEEVFNVLRSVNGFGDFLAYQVLVDLLYPLKIYKNKPLLPYSNDDWSKAGPGARKGVKILSNNNYLEVMTWLRDNQEKEFKRLHLDFPYYNQRISLANIQNCLCEFHKYVKISNGTGRGRRKFIPVIHNQ